MIISSSFHFHYFFDNKGNRKEKQKELKEKFKNKILKVCWQYC